MNDQITLTRDLTKWPRLLVTGDQVTEDQANEILVRTNRWWLWINDQDWQRQIYNLIGVAFDKHLVPEREPLRAFEEAHGVLDLHYLDNARVASSWIGGPHGWCDWDGIISACTYNIGKWPSAGEVLDDCRVIAAAFPYLNLRAQLAPDEGAASPVIEFRIDGGTVTWTTDPTELVTAPAELSMDTVMRRMTLFGGERGVTRERLAEALHQVLIQRAGQQ